MNKKLPLWKNRVINETATTQELTDRIRQHQANCLEIMKNQEFQL